MKYLVKLTPCEPYFFGDENSFRIGEKKANYYIKSIPMPSATTITGMLRYVVLEQSGVLNTGFSYDKDAKMEMDRLVGESGYQVGGCNDLGVIKSISPLFVVDKNGNKYVQLPFNHKVIKRESKEKNGHYTPIRMDYTRKVTTGYADMYLPEKGEIDIKNEVSEALYVNTATGEIKEIFRGEERVGIRKKGDDDAFFKKLYMVLEDGYSFAFVCEMEYEIKDTICYMGREKSAFSLHTEPYAGEITDEIASDLSRFTDEPFYYALSDLVIKKPINYTAFSIMKTGLLRCLESVYADGKIKITRRESLHNIVKKGSIFMEEPENGTFYEEGYGLNNLIKIGGNK